MCITLQNVLNTVTSFFVYAHKELRRPNVIERFENLPYTKLVEALQAIKNITSNL